MATLPQKIETEMRMRQLLEDNGLPQPDCVEYGFTCIRLFYEAQKTCIVIDIDDPPDGEDGEVGNGRSETGSEGFG